LILKEEHRKQKAPVLILPNQLKSKKADLLFQAKQLVERTMPWLRGKFNKINLFPSLQLQKLSIRRKNKI